MAFEIHMVEMPAEVPEGFPPMDEKDLGHYRLRHIDGMMLIDVMIAFACIVEAMPTPETVLSSPAHTGAFLRQDGTVVTPNQCGIIARELRPVIQDGIPPEAVEFLRTNWNQRQDELKAAVVAKGEVPLAGFEHFPYEVPALRNFVIHWGFYNAIAADHGGYAVT